MNTIIKELKILQVNNHKNLKQLQRLELVKNRILLQRKNLNVYKNKNQISDLQLLTKELFKIQSKIDDLKFKIEEQQKTIKAYKNYKTF